MVKKKKTRRRKNIFPRTRRVKERAPRRRNRFEWYISYVRTSEVRQRQRLKRGRARTGSGHDVVPCTPVARLELSCGTLVIYFATSIGPKRRTADRFDRERDEKNFSDADGPGLWPRTQRCDVDLPAVGPFVARWSRTMSLSFEFRSAGTRIENGTVRRCRSSDVSLFYRRPRVWQTLFSNRIPRASDAHQLLTFHTRCNLLYRTVHCLAAFYRRNEFFFRDGRKFKT